MNMQNTQLSAANVVCPAADAATLVTQERQAVYGCPSQDFVRIADMMTALGFRFVDPRTNQAGDIRPEHVPSFMILVKLSRMAHNPNNYHADSLLDIKGYAKTAEIVNEKLYA